MMLKSHWHTILLLDAQYTGGCSGSRSDCCTRVCSQDSNFVSTESDWEKFLEVKGGQVQY